MQAVRLACVMSLLLLPAIVQATPVTFAFSGAVTDDPFGLAGFGAPIVGAFTFDSGAGDNIAAMQNGSFASNGSGFDFQVTIDGTSYAVLGNVTVNTANNIGVDQYGVIATDAGLSLELFLEDDTQTALMSDGLPLQPPGLESFGFRQFRLFADDAQFLGSVTRLDCAAGCATTSVPEPASLILVAIAGLGLLGSGMRRKV